MGLGKDEGELGEFRGLKSKKNKIDPAARSKNHGADFGNQHSNQQKNGGPINDQRPAGDSVIIDQANPDREGKPDDVPGDLHEVALRIPGSGIQGFVGHGSAVDEADANDHQAGNGADHEPIKPGVLLSENLSAHAYFSATRGALLCAALSRS